MRILVQRVSKAHVTVNNTITGSIERGVLALVGFAHNDTIDQVTWLVNKLVHLRIFEDSEGKINRSLIDYGGSVLLVSQFTLYANCTEGRRPSFSQAASPKVAEALYQQCVEAMHKTRIPVETGIFGAEMQVFLINDGPVTLMLER